MTDRAPTAATLAQLPYAAYLGIEVVSAAPGQLRVQIPFSDRLVGNVELRAMHGGAVAALIEVGAQLAVMHATRAHVPPETIDSRVDYLRSGQPQMAFADVEIVRLGRRVANLRVTAWQESPARPFATGNITFLLRAG